MTQVIKDWFIMIGQVTADLFRLLWSVLFVNRKK